MPKAGDRFVMPQGLGEYRVVRSHEETGGEFVEMEWVMPAGAFAPPPHRHPTQVESYEVLEGSFDVMVDGKWLRLDKGDYAEVPPGVSHTFKVEREDVRVRNFHRAGSHFDSFIERQHRFVTSDRFKGVKHPSTALAMAAAWHVHSDLLVPTPAPLRAAVAVLGPIGRRRGY